MGTEVKKNEKLSELRGDRLTCSKPERAQCQTRLRVFLVFAFLHCSEFHLIFQHSGCFNAFFAPSSWLQPPGQDEKTQGALRASSLTGLPWVMPGKSPWSGSATRISLLEAEGGRQETQILSSPLKPRGFFPTEE